MRVSDDRRFTALDPEEYDVVEVAAAHPVAARGEFGGRSSVDRRPMSGPKWQRPTGNQGDGKDDGDNRHRATAGRRASRFWQRGYPLFTLLMVGVIPLVAWQGVIALDGASRGNRRSGVETVQAVVGTTPTALVVVTGDDGAAVSYTLVARSGRDGGGAALVMPAEVVTSVSPFAVPWADVDPEAEAVPIRLGDAHDIGGPEGARETVQEVIGIGIDNVMVVSTEEFAEAVRPVAPLRFQNQIETPLGRRTLGVGSVALAPDEVADALVYKGEEEPEENRLLRSQAIWSSWLSGVSDAGVEAARPEVSPELFDEIAHLSNGPTEFPLFPFRRIVLADTGEGESVLDVVDAEALRSQVLELVPFPAVLGGELPSVAVLSATGELDDADAAAARLGNTGTSLVSLGVHTLDGEEPALLSSTEVVYYDEERREVARAVLEALGTGELVLERGASALADVTVLVGSDLAG